MKFFKKIIVLFFLVFFSLAISWGDSTKDSIKANLFSWDIKKVHFGLGATATTANLLGVIENAKLYQALINGQDYDYPGMTQEEKDAVGNLSKAMIGALIAGNMMASMEYGIKARFMYHVFISDIDFIFLPCDGSYNGRFDFQIIPSFGVRMPWFIMPYIMVGPSFTFSFYPDEVSNVENWKTETGYGVADRFVFRPGLNLKVGLDFNFKVLSFGVFYQYEVKDFAEFTDFYNFFIDSGYSPSEAGKRIFGYQSRFGIALTIYIIK